MFSLSYKSALIILISFTLITGCGEGLQQRLAADSELEEQEDVSPDNEEEVTQTEPTEDVPDEIPLYPNAELVDEQIDEEEAFGRLQWLSPDSMEEIIAFYEQELGEDNWEVETPFTEGQDGEEIMEARSRSLNLSVLVADAQTPQPSHTILIEYQRRSPEEETTEDTTEEEVVEEDTTREFAGNFNDLDETPEALQEKVEDLAELGILTPLEEGEEEFAPNEPITRGTFARWLFQANNEFYSDRSSQQIRPVNQAETRAFQDISQNDPDFPIIQGLAETGLIPSRLTGDDDVTRFRPDRSLTRETLLLWKVPLDIRRSLPSVDVETIEDTWGFRDANAIDSEALGAIAADYRNGEDSNLRRVYGYTQLLQPQREVTRAEAAAALWSFGTQGEIISANELLAEN
ncbi:S-layer homology domain-containing protein [Euhalothece natronophila Z-M001]|uniref:S-layer homology domain-containing protein n=1 Tax=Euhalothece natronophila Z-M001 TaxID=522448 RepID=A0A5B8NNV9_9CHRO|nr:S-layer homology domain-containing protein [Euhalothece natronophila]QDZ39869.1 S-layer homology domain-containing protein [Euhalothece natronophila Z-M001]